jgi:demethylspheroidene O-methyltransferase
VAAAVAWIRDFVLAKPSRQRWFMSIPFVGRYVRQQSRAVFDLVAGFAYSQTLLAAVELGWLERLRGGRRLSTQSLAMEDGLNPEAALRLANAAAALDLLKPVNERGVPNLDTLWELGGHGAVIAASPAMLALVRHHKSVYRDLADPIALLRGELGSPELRKTWAYVNHRGQGQVLEEDDVAPYSALMASSQPLVSEQVLQAYDFSSHRQMLDLGGGMGAFACAVARQHPALKITVFDLPAVSRLADRAVAQQGLSGQVRCVGGDFFSDEVPEGADLVSLVRVLYDHPDAFVLRLLERAYGLLRPVGGRLLIAEPMALGREEAAMSDAYFGLYLCAMGGGRARSPAELEALLKRAGFRSIRLLRTQLPIQTGLLVADV